jgi:hypothetical protein
MAESILPADISFTSESSSSRESLAGANTITLTLDDILSYAGLPMAMDSSSSRCSDRDSDVTSPSSVMSAVSEMDSGGKAEEGGGGSGAVDPCGGDKFVCQMQNCGRAFERETLLKRHLKMHAGECR